MGELLPDLLRQHGIASGTFFRWNSRHGGLEPSQLQPLRQLLRENNELKKIVADQALDIRMLKDVNSKTARARYVVVPLSLVTIKTSLGDPGQPFTNERWSLDFVHDRLANGRSLRLFTVHDDYTRECLWIEVDNSLSGPRVARALDYVAQLRGWPTSLLTANGPEFTGLALERWAHDH